MQSHDETHFFRERDWLTCTGDKQRDVLVDEGCPIWNKTVTPASSEEPASSEQPASSEAWGAPLVDRLSFWQALTDGGQEGAIMRLGRGMDGILTILQVPHLSAMAPLPIASHDPADSRADAWMVSRERKRQ